MYLATTKRFGLGDDTASDDSATEIDLGAGGLSASDFNSTRYPGICKPTNLNALNSVLAMQRQMNRVVKGGGGSNGIGKNLQMIAPDGDVGPGTMKLYNAITASGSTDCLAIATQSAAIALDMKVMADSVFVPASIDQPSAPKPSYIPPGATMPVPVPTPESSGIVGTFKSMSSGMQLAVAGLLAAGGYLAFTRHKKSKRTSRRY